MMKIYTKQKSIHIVRLPRTASIELIPCLPRGETLINMYKRLRKSGQTLPQLLVNANFFHLDGGRSSQLVMQGKQVNWQWTRRKIFAALAVYGERPRG